MRETRERGSTACTKLLGEYHVLLHRDGPMTMACDIMCHLVRPYIKFDRLI